MIRAAAAELPSVPLEDALDICLALLDLEPHTYPRTATRWGSRLAIERKLDLVDAQLALAALAALPGPAAKAGAEALIEISNRYGPAARWGAAPRLARSPRSHRLDLRVRSTAALVDQERLEPAAIAVGMERFVAVAQQSGDPLDLVQQGELAGRVVPLA